jgi:hypothetical protein
MARPFAIVPRVPGTVPGTQAHMGAMCRARFPIGARGTRHQSTSSTSKTGRTKGGLCTLFGMPAIGPRSHTRTHGDLTHA